MNAPAAPAPRFVVIDSELRDRLVADHGEFARIERLDPSAEAPPLLEVVEQTLELHAASPRSAPWGGYLAIDDAGRTVVGTCGFKHGPDAEGRVEIAYFTFPAFERRGYATAMARHLLSLAAASPEAPIVRAHTLPERNTSARLLERLRFRRTGTVDDPEDGTVWRWERSPTR